MRSSTFLPLALFVVLSIVWPTPVASRFSKRELRAREVALATLPEVVRQDLARRDPSEYELDTSGYIRRGGDDEGTLVRRDDDAAVTNCLSDDSIAMTYDDGPYTWERELTDMYADAGMHITYFINVNNWACSYDSPFAENLQYARSKGMTIASHTATHPDLQTLTLAQIDEQIELVEKFTYKTLGLIPRFFRPPYGSTNDTINQHLKDKWGLTVITWATDSGDSDNDPPSESITKVTSTTGGEIILNHETRQTSVEQVAPAMIKDLQSKGRKSIGMRKCLGGINPYKVKLADNAPKRDNTWNCDGVPAPGESNV